MLTAPIRLLRARAFSTCKRLSTQKLFDIDSLLDQTSKPGNGRKTNRFATQYLPPDGKSSGKSGTNRFASRQLPPDGDEPRTPNRITLKSSNDKVGEKSFERFTAKQSSSEAKPFSGRGKNGKNAPGNRKNAGETSKKTRTVRFLFESGTEKAKSALKSIITDVHECAPNYRVNYVDPDTRKLKKVHLVDIVNNLDLNTLGLLLVPPKDDSLPLIRTVDVSDMIRLYSDKLASMKEQELLALGSTRAQRALQKRLQTEKKKSATKVIAIAWSISTADLMNQKKKEILNRIASSEKFSIYLGEKLSLYNARKQTEKDGGVVGQLDSPSAKLMADDEQHAIELRRRELLFDKLQEILHDVKFEVSGSVDGRMMVSVHPKVALKTEVKDSEEELSKESRRRKKAEKTREQAEQAKKKPTEDDLDALYLFKIDQ